MGSGIGLASARLAKSLGAHVSGTVFNKAQRDAVAPIVSADHCFELDVTDENALHSAIRQAAEASEGLDGILSSAGMIKLLRSEETSPPDWARILDVNLNASFQLAKCAIPYLRQNKASAIVMISSQIGLVGHKNAAAYAASKSAINGLARSMALELAPVAHAPEHKRGGAQQDPPTDHASCDAALGRDVAAFTATEVAFVAFGRSRQLRRRHQWWRRQHWLWQR